MERVSSDGGGLCNVAIDQVRRIGRRLAAWYIHTPPADRVTWGGMTACAGLGLGVLLERLARLRRHRIVPPEFTARFLDRLHEGKLDCGEALDHCERNPSPAARVALAAVRRWGRPAAESGSEATPTEPKPDLSQYPDKERRELTKQRDVIYIYDGDKGYEKTFKGTAARTRRP